MKLNDAPITLSLGRLFFLILPLPFLPTLILYFMLFYEEAGKPSTYKRDTLHNVALKTQAWIKYKFALNRATSYFRASKKQYFYNPSLQLGVTLHFILNVLPRVNIGRPDVSLAFVEYYEFLCSKNWSLHDTLGLEACIGHPYLQRK